MNARQSRRGKRISQQQEKNAAADLGGRTMAASGATRLGGGGDVRLMGKIRLECKFTEKDTYTLKLVELEKIKKQAFKSLEYPVFQFAFRDRLSKLEQYAVIQWDGDLAPFARIETKAKSLTLSRNGIRAHMERGTLQLFFEFTDADKILRRRYFQVMRWDDFVTRHNANA